MEENQPKTGKFAMNFGLLLGASSLVFGLMLYFLDMHYQGGIPVFIVSLVLMLAFVIMGMVQFKRANQGLMSFGQGLKIGVGVCLIGGVIGIVFNLLMTNVIDPETIEKALEYQKGQLIASGDLTSERIEAQIEGQKKFSTPFWQVTFGLLFSVILGFLLSLLPALVIKKKKETLN
ncbi:MAG: DUF4199 domain-containing protein [Saonia sp.]